MRTLIEESPFEFVEANWSAKGRWPARWVTHPNAVAGKPVVMTFSLNFTLETSRTIRFHVSADQRYDLFIHDKHFVGRGPERSDLLNWFFETYDIPFKAGTHQITARVWNLAQQAPLAMISSSPAFILAPELPEDVSTFATGVAPWTVADITGAYELLPCQMMVFTGDRVLTRSSRQKPGQSTTPVSLEHGYNDHQQTDQPRSQRILRPATLGPLVATSTCQPTVRHICATAAPARHDDYHEVLAADHIQSEAKAWNDLLLTRKPLTIPPHTTRRVLVDLNDYVCAFPSLTAISNSGDSLTGVSTVRVHWAESLFEKPDDGKMNGWWHFKTKGHRSQVEGKYFVGNGDQFVIDTPGRHTFDTLWWLAGRYVEIAVQTQDHPLTLENFRLEETHYPYQWQASFESSDARLERVTPIMKRVMEMCSHETYVDCPYYEQLMYVGDTRLEVLVSYTWANDDTLPRRALDLFEKSRKPPGFTQSRYPARSQQVIPPFSLWWIAMVHDFAMWRNDPAFVRSLLPGVRGVLDAFHFCHDPDTGLTRGPNGWNFIDWVPAWKSGIPPDGVKGFSAPLQFKLVGVLQQAAELETQFGEPELAALYSRRAQQLLVAAEKAYWSEPRNMYADDLQHQHFSEHTQCLALLTGRLDPTKIKHLTRALLDAPDLARTTVYFNHYLFEVCKKLGMVDHLIGRMSLWFELESIGFKTTIESPEPSRSDCHAWGAHPMFHYLATICGIRPADFGFQTVEICPQLGPLEFARGSMPHANGAIVVDVRRVGEVLSGRVTLPPGLSGVVIANAKRLTIEAGATVTF